MLYDNKKCFVCEENLDEIEEIFMLGLDRPYVNLWFHKVCLNEIDDLLAYLETKIDKIEKEIPIYY